MLDDQEIEQLCCGRLVYADVYSSSGTDAAGPHWAVILDSDETITEHDSYFVAVISHSREDAFVMPVPAYLGLTGFVQGSWIAKVDLPGIIKTGAKVLPPDMQKVNELLRAARAARTGQPKRKREP